MNPERPAHSGSGANGKKNMADKKNALTLSIFLIFFLGLFCFGGQGYSVKEALKVLDIIDRIEREQMDKGLNEIRSIDVTESEFNSYIAHRIKTEKEEVLKELKFKMLDKNRIEVMALVDLKGQNLPSYLAPKMVFFFGGKLEVQDGGVRLKLDDLFLGNQRIQPMVLDLVIFIASKIQNTEPSSIEDWYELPYGIKDIKTRAGRATFFY
jgi:hypothetical protein